MDLVIKINDRCNFRCDFCSSNEIATNHKDLDIDLVKKFLIEHNPMCLIVNGGDPLMVDPNYYWELLKYIENNNLRTTISLTTNLWDFKLHPEKWVELFKHRLIGVCTSFQYGTERKVATGEIYTEELFRETFNLYEKLLGEKLTFIAVINKNNDDTVIKTVELAKELGTICRVNGAVRSGRTTEAYPFYKMVGHYINIIDHGLSEYEMNCKLLMASWNNKTTECPFNINCHNEIRCMSPDGTIHNCPSIADDILKGTHDFFTLSNSKLPFELSVIHGQCYTCRAYKICNSCTKRIIDIKKGIGAEKHCSEMHVYFGDLKRIDENHLCKDNKQMQSKM